MALPLKKLRIVLWALVALGACLLLVMNFMRAAPQPVPYEKAALSEALGGVGGAFTLTDHRGKPFTEKDLAGKPSLMFFGFTFCPDVCPTTLADMTHILEKLGPDADRLNVVFVSVDPARDTPEQMQRYLSMFDPRITGLTGTPEQLAEMAKNYRIYYKKVDMEDGNYTMDHNASTYLLNKDAKLVATIAYQENSAIALEKVKRLLVAAP